MNQLLPIIRRVRRPLLAEGHQKVADNLAQAPSTAPPAKPETDSPEREPEQETKIEEPAGE